MEVKIGIQSVPRELVIETDMTAEQVESALGKALEAKVALVLSTQKDGRLIIPADKVAYLELGGTGSRRVGF